MSAITPSGTEAQIAIVTGASGGIGEACASRLAAQGFCVLALDREGQSATELSLADAEHGQILSVGLDITDQGQVEELQSLLREHGKNIGALVNAAGVFQDISRLEALSLEEHDRVWAVNYHGTYRMCRTFGIAMARQGGGAIVNISSINAFRATPLLAYAPAKAALNHLTACLAAELGRSGVRVNAVCPGFTLTPALAAKVEAGLRDATAILSATALGSWVLPEDVAEAVAFLVSPQAKAITGVALPVDAGWLAGEGWSTFGGLPSFLKD